MGPSKFRKMFSLSCLPQALLPEVLRGKVWPDRICYNEQNALQVEEQDMNGKKKEGYEEIDVTLDSE